MEQVHDLLAEKEGARLDVRQGAQGTHMPGLTEERVVGVEQAWTYLKRGQKSRALAATNMNESSSRSHCLLCLRVHGRSKLNGNTNCLNIAKAAIIRYHSVLYCYIVQLNSKEAQHIMLVPHKFSSILAVPARIAQYPATSLQVTHGGQSYGSATWLVVSASQSLQLLVSASRRLNSLTSPCLPWGTASMPWLAKLLMCPSATAS